MRFELTYRVYIVKICNLSKLVYVLDVLLLIGLMGWYIGPVSVLTMCRAEAEFGKSLLNESRS